MAVKISAEAFETEVLQSDVPVLVDFYSDSCVPCKRMSPVLAELEEQYAGRLKLCKVNLDSNEELVEKNDIMSAPTLLFFKDGQEQDRKTGYVGKNALLEIINKLMEG